MEQDSNFNFMIPQNFDGKRSELHAEMGIRLIARSSFENDTTRFINAVNFLECIMESRLDNYKRSIDGIEKDYRTLVKEGIDKEEKLIEGVYDYNAIKPVLLAKARFKEMLRCYYSGEEEEGEGIVIPRDGDERASV